jgi:hypothetical protein
MATLSSIITPSNITTATNTQTLTNKTLTDAVMNGGTVGATSLSTSGNLNFTGTSNRITGDFSNATPANRVSFQTSTANGSTLLNVLPNGTGTSTSLVLINASDPTNCSFAQFGASGSTEVLLNSGAVGTGTFLPMTFQTNGSERMRITTAGNVGIGTTSPAYKLDVNGNIRQSSTALVTAVAGLWEYDGSVNYVTPSGTQRGVVPGMQYYALNETLAGANVNTAQNVLGVGVTLSSSTRYAFEGVYALSKTAGTTSHTTSIGFGGTATINSIGYWAQAGAASSSGFTNTSGSSASSFHYYIQTTASTVVNGAQAAASSFRLYKISGTVSVGTGGTFIPQYTLSAAPGGAYTTAAGCWFRIYPIGAADSNVAVGTWA